MKFITEQVAVKKLRRRPVRTWCMIFFVFMLSAAYSGIFQATGLLDTARAGIARMSRRITPFGAMLCTAVAASMIACNQTLSILLTHQLCTDVPGGAPSPDLKTAPNVVQ